MNPDFLEKLNNAYTAVSEKFKDHYRLELIDTSESMDPKPESTAREVVLKILDVLEEKPS